MKLSNIYNEVFVFIAYKNMVMVLDSVQLCFNFQFKPVIWRKSRSEISVMTLHQRYV